MTHKDDIQAVEKLGAAYGKITSSSAA